MIIIKIDEFSVNKITNKNIRNKLSSFLFKMIYSDVRYTKNLFPCSIEHKMQIYMSAFVMMMKE